MTKPYQCYNKKVPPEQISIEHGKYGARRPSE